MALVARPSPRSAAEVADGATRNLRPRVSPAAQHAAVQRRATARWRGRASAPEHVAARQRGRASAPEHVAVQSHLLQHSVLEHLLPRPLRRADGHEQRHQMLFARMGAVARSARAWARASAQPSARARAGCTRNAPPGVWRLLPPPHALPPVALLLRAHCAVQPGPEPGHPRALWPPRHARAHRPQVVRRLAGRQDEDPLAPQRAQRAADLQVPLRVQRRGQRQLQRGNGRVREPARRACVVSVRARARRPWQRDRTC